MGLLKGGARGQDARKGVLAPTPSSLPPSASETPFHQSVRSRKAVAGLTGALLGFVVGYFFGEGGRGGVSPASTESRAREVSSVSTIRAGSAVPSPDNVFRFGAISRSRRSSAGGLAVPRTPWREIGNAHSDRGEWDLAIHSYERAVRSGDSDPALLSDLAVAYRNRGDSLRAVATLQRALEKDPSHWSSSLNLALIYAFDLSDADAAERHLKEVERLGREFPQRDLVRARIAQLRDAATASRRLPGRKSNGN
jgi:tetratricopeptide (TPR) repeat protein